MCGLFDDGVGHDGSADRGTVGLYDVGHVEGQGARPMTTARRGLLYHFTHLSNLASIAEQGIFCDFDVEGSHRLTIEVGQQGIKAKRRHRRPGD